jgi:hypothetical protein
MTKKAIRGSFAFSGVLRLWEDNTQKQGKRQKKKRKKTEFSPSTTPSTSLRAKG